MSASSVTVLLSRTGELHDRYVISHQAVYALGYKPCMHMQPKQFSCITLTDSLQGLVHLANAACYTKQMQQGIQELRS